MSGEIIAVIAIILIIGGAVFYIVRAKKRGNRCIGCPYGASCNGKCSQNKDGTNAKDK